MFCKNKIIGFLFIIKVVVFSLSKVISLSTLAKSIVFILLSIQYLLFSNIVHNYNLSCLVLVSLFTIVTVERFQCYMYFIPGHAQMNDVKLPLNSIITSEWI